MRQIISVPSYESSLLRDTRLVGPARGRSLGNRLYPFWMLQPVRDNSFIPREELLAAEEPIEIEGTVFTVLPGTMFRVKLDNGHEILAHLSGKMRKHFVRLTVGDRVRLEMSPYDLTKARITYRLR